MATTSKVALPILFFIAWSANAQCVKQPHNPVDLQTYYQSADGLTGNDLKIALNNRIRGHTRYSYTPCVWAILKEADEALGDTSSVFTIYTRRNIAKTDQDDGSNDQNSWNREHIWAKSHGFPKKSQHGFTDAHHIRAADRSVNSDRSDNDFDDGGVPDDECSGCSEGDGTWEPPDSVKGDVARMMFYMDVRYDSNDGTGTPDLRLVDRADTPRSQTVGEFGKLCTLLQWHTDDPVSNEETRRNEIVHSWQGNRNPFIDRPEFVNEIWATQCPAFMLANNMQPATQPLDEADDIRARIAALESELAALRLRLAEFESP